MDDTLARSRRALKDIKKQIRQLDNPRPRRSSWRRWLLLGAGALFLLFSLLPPFTLPLDAPVTSGYLLRWAPDSWWPRVEFHRALDYGAPAGTPVRVVSPGIVRATGFDPGGYGNWVKVVHFLGVESVYAHLSELSVRSGDWILPSVLQQVGRVGSTGRSTGPHLHLEIRWLGLPLPPQMFLVFHHIRRLVLGF